MAAFLKPEPVNLHCSFQAFPHCYAALSPGNCTQKTSHGSFYPSASNYALSPSLSLSLSTQCFSEVLLAEYVAGSLLLVVFVVSVFLHYVYVVFLPSLLDVLAQSSQICC